MLTFLPERTVSKKTHEQILKEMRGYEPISPATVRASLSWLWVSLLVIASLLPFGVVMYMRASTNLLGENATEVAVVMIMLGGVALLTSILQLRRRDLRHNFGLSPISSEQAVELGNLSMEVPEFMPIVDHWLEMWVDTRTPARLRDLEFLRCKVEEWRMAEAHQGSPATTASLAE